LDFSNSLLFILNFKQNYFPLFN